MMTNIIAQLDSQINKSRERIDQLKRSSFELKREITNSGKKEKDHNSNENLAIKSLERDIEILKSELDETIKLVMHLSNKFKNLVKKEHLAHLQSKVDDWNLTNFITRKEFDELIRSYR